MKLILFIILNLVLSSCFYIADGRLTKHFQISLEQECTYQFDKGSIRLYKGSYVKSIKLFKDNITILEDSVLILTKFTERFGCHGIFPFWWTDKCSHPIYKEAPDSIYIELWADTINFKKNLKKEYEIEMDTIFISLENRNSCEK